jgi:hypothetical protein
MTEWTEETVEERFREAAYIMRRLPTVKVQGYFNLWPGIKYTEMEILQQPAMLRLGPPTGEAIDRMEETLRWLLWLSVDDRKLVWLRAERVRWKQICFRQGCDRTTAWRRYKVALARIAAYLTAREG